MTDPPTDDTEDREPDALSRPDRLRVPHKSHTPRHGHTGGVPPDKALSDMGSGEWGVGRVCRVYFIYNKKSRMRMSLWGKQQRAYLLFVLGCFYFCAGRSQVL
eukprot:scaffold12131_cov112-Isochrysis_galbana.AAC.6